MPRGMSLDAPDASKVPPRQPYYRTRYQSPTSERVLYRDLACDFQRGVRNDSSVQPLGCAR